MKSTCLISTILPLSTLDEDFTGHSVYLEKLKLMKQNYRGIRRLRRDGNCFYRAFGFAYIEYLLNGKLIKEAGRFVHFFAFSCFCCMQSEFRNYT
ncbi:unnamed protein product [Schistosoma turkestanicum]|nr:unnamed protein product [Schistosoma turkestanicum]